VVYAGTAHPYFTDKGQFDYAGFLLDERDYAGAAREFERLIEKFPASEHIGEAQYLLAEAYLASGRFAEAEAELRLFASNFPGGPLASKAGRRAEEAREAALRAASLRRPLPARRVLRRVPPGPSARAARGMRAVQVAFFEARDYRELEDELREIRDAGVDTVIVRVFHNLGDRYYPMASHGSDRGVYFRTSRAPVVDDILGEIVRASHASGLRVFAWMTTRYADYGVEWDGRIACRAYDFDERALTRCKGLDLFNERAVRRLEAVYSDLAEYDIDGVLFQDDLVLRHNEGFGPSAQALFRRFAHRGFSPSDLYEPPDASGAVRYKRLFWKWASWKNLRLLEVASRLRDVVRAKRPKARFAINLMYESVTNPPGALAWLSQDLRSAAHGRAGRFDYYSIMAYNRQMQAELGKDAGQVERMIEKMAADAADVAGGPERVLMKLQTVEWDTGEPLPDSEMVRLMRGVGKTGGIGMALVPYRRGLPLGELAGRSAGLLSLRRTAGHAPEETRGTP